MDRVLKRYLEKQKFCDKKYKPIGIRPYSILPLREIINKYNSIIQGTANYYFPVIDRVTSFSRIYYILQYSCYGTIATKYKTTIYKLFKKYGKFPKFNIELKMQFKYNAPNKIQEETKSSKDKITIEVIPYQKAKENALNIKHETNENPFSPLKKINWRTYKNLRGYCCICGSRENIEWHHVKSIKKGKVSGFTQVMKQLNRKQLPFCSEHHLQVTQGKYSDKKISDLVQIEYLLS